MCPTPCASKSSTALASDGKRHVLLARGVRLAFVTGYPKTVLPRRFDGIPLYEKPFEPHRVLSGLLADDAEPA